MTIKFADYKNKIMQTLSQKREFLGFTESVTLLEGFINSPIQQELSKDLVIGGPTIPSIAVVGNSSGRIYYFALKALIPEIEI